MYISVVYVLPYENLWKLLGIPILWMIFTKKIYYMVMKPDRDLRKLKKPIRQACSAFLKETKKKGLHVFVTEAKRSIERQRYLYAQGRTRPGKVVTWTLHSRHIVGEAFDIAFEPKKHGSLYPSDAHLWEKVGVIGEWLWLEWWWRWKAWDKPHFQWAGATSWYENKNSSKHDPKYEMSTADDENETSDGNVWQRLVEQFITLHEEGKITNELLVWVKDKVSDYIKKVDIKEVAVDYFKKVDWNEVLDELVYLAVQMMKK